MVKVGKWIAKHKYLIILISILLMIPSVIGMAKTRVNYDILSYLPDTLETRARILWLMNTEWARFPWSSWKIWN